MPENGHPEYNPLILGFSEQQGPMSIPLQEAREIYGRLPSSYGFVPPKEGRENKKGLNLCLGKFIRETFKNGPCSFKKEVIDYFDSWHRDYPSEFGFDIRPFLNMNDPDILVKIIRRNQACLEHLLQMDLRTYLVGEGLIRKDIVNSIKDRDLHAISSRILEKKKRKLEKGEKRDRTETALNRIEAVRILKTVEQLIASDLCAPDLNALSVFADEVAKRLIALPEDVGFKGRDDLHGIRGKGIEFEFAPRDAAYLTLGKSTGDCTADKKNFQADRNIENIFWTIFSWILDQNYQILKVHYEGEFIMKVHLLPLYISDTGVGSSSASIFMPGKSEYVILALDAVETIRAFRQDLPAFQKAGLIEKKEMIFEKTMEKIRAIAFEMGIESVYAEKFSNTDWVRDALESFEEIFLHVGHIQKIDQLEDVYYLARALCMKNGWQPPGELFMEIQMKNIYLSPKTGSRTPGVKSFAVIKGDPAAGIPMNRVIGV